MFSWLNMNNISNPKIIREKVEFKKFKFNERLDGYEFECDCGEKHFIANFALKRGERIAKCPNCDSEVEIIDV